jgi:mono/diheme cytochrome c family protein
VTVSLAALLFFARALALHSEESNTAAIRYSEEQALQGRGLYNEHCASCHGAALEGQGSLPLSGATFRARWADDRHSVDDLFYIIRTLMPYGQPATLSKQEYLDVIQYEVSTCMTGNGTRPKKALRASQIRSLNPCQPTTIARAGRSG